MKKNIKITFIGGGSLNWAPTILRDIIFKEGMEKANINFRLLDPDAARLKTIKKLFDCRLKEWGCDWARIDTFADANRAISGADFVIIAISTGALATMKHDLKMPEKYGIYHTVGDTAGPGGWSRALRNIPVFKDYGRKIRQLAPNAFVLNYTNPMGALTNVLAGELGNNRVIGLCHGLFENYEFLKRTFHLESEKEIQLKFGGLNHFFWILDFKIKGKDGYKLLKEKLKGKRLSDLVRNPKADAMGFKSDRKLAEELFENYGYLPYLGDRHTCEFFGSYLASRKLMARFNLKRTSIAERAKGYRDAAKRINLWTKGEDADWPFTREPSRETAADIIKAVAFDGKFTDVVNMVNVGQIPNLTEGAVVETMGRISGNGFAPLPVGPMPDSLKILLRPHAETQIKTVRAGLSGNLEEALMALAGDPLCGHLTITDVKQMGRELLKANQRYLPQFFGG